MFDLVTKPLAWLFAILLALVFWWVVVRLAFVAYFKSRLEYYKKHQENNKKNEENL